MVKIGWILKILVKHQLILVKYSLIFSWGKANLLTGLHLEFFWLSLIVMLNGHPHSQVMLSKIITPSKNTSRLSYSNGRNVATSKGKGKFYNCQWMFLGHSPGKFSLHYFPPVTRHPLGPTQWHRPNWLGICWGQFTWALWLYTKHSNTPHNPHVDIKNTGITNLVIWKSNSEMLHNIFSV